MSSDKRDFSDFTAFPGEITPAGWYVFPQLSHADAKGKTRIWKLQIRLIKTTSRGLSAEAQTGEWVLRDFAEIPILQKYLEGTPLPAGILAQIWTESGIEGGQITRHKPSHPSPKNVGRSNERNSLLQALVEGRSKWAKKRQAGARAEGEEADEVGAAGAAGAADEAGGIGPNQRLYPMLLNKYEDYGDNVEYPAHVQPKLDGLRAVVHLNGAGEVDIYSRQLKDILGFDQHRPILHKILVSMQNGETKESIFIDGEFYQHGLSLQMISGIVRNPEKSCITSGAPIVPFVVFDAFYPSKKGETLEVRIKYCDAIRQELTKIEKSAAYVKQMAAIATASGHKSIPPLVTVIDTATVATEAEFNRIYTQYLKRKYEGAVVKNISSLYLSDPRRNSAAIRSKFVLKRKAKYTDEYKVTGYKCGEKGKDVNALIWECETKEGHLFTVVPKDISYEERYEMYRQLQSDPDRFKNKFLGRMLTVEYEDLSESGTPMRAKALIFRDD